MNNLIIYSDFDGTITTYDAFDKIITNVYSYATYKKLEQLTLENKLPYELYLEMFNGITYDIPSLTSELDPTFQEFYTWIQTNSIEFYIISAGFKTIIKEILPFVNPDIIYSNDITIENNGWKVKFYDALSIRKTEIIDLHHKPTHTSIYIGDGLSDFKVIGKVDYLFCKKDSMLHTKCLEEHHTHIVFTNFTDVLDKIKKLIIL